MLIDPGRHLGDSWYYVDGDTVHCYYLVCPDSVERHTAWDIAHASSSDLVNWDLHGVVIRRGEDHEWDGNCLATGSVAEWGDGFLLAYTARWNETGVATGLATSADLHNWHKMESNPSTRPGLPYVVDRQWSDRPPTHWRDPFLLERDGALVQLIAAARSDRPEDASGAVGIATSRDAVEWALQEPLVVDAVSRELECPQVHLIDGRWFLIFSAFAALFSAETAADPEANLGQGTYAMIGDGPDGPFRFVQREPIVSRDHPDQLYAGQVVTFKSQAYLLGTVWRDEGDYISDPLPLRRKDEWVVVAD